MTLQEFRALGRTLRQHELETIDRRIDVIDATLDLCGPNDWDVVDNLNAELDELLSVLESSLALRKGGAA